MALTFSVAPSLAAHRDARFSHAIHVAALSASALAGAACHSDAPNTPRTMGTVFDAAGVSSADVGPPNPADSVLERNHHASRDGLFLQSSLTRPAISAFRRNTEFVAAFDGNMWASPLFLADGPNHRGAFFVVTTGNDVFALDEVSGAIVWSTHVGDSPAANGVNCGDIHPLGILSTPVIDAAARTLYVAAAVGTTAIARHEIHALSVDDGKERAGWPVQAVGLTSGSQTFAAPPQNQRSALSLVGGILYVAYGGHIGDCGPYHGWVVAIDTANPSSRGAWATLGQGEGIWAAGGLASDGTSVFAITGNNTAGAADRTVSDSEEVVRLTGLATMTRSGKNLFYPASWKDMDAADADFGSNNPIYLNLPGSTPSTAVVAISKDGQFYLLDSANLGGMAGHVASVSIATGWMAIHTSPAAFSTAKGVHVVLSTDSGASCPSGTASGKSILSVLIHAGAPPRPEVEWCAPLDGPNPGPIATTVDGIGLATVWYMNGGVLTAVDGDTGAPLFASSDSCSGVRQWTSPIAVKGRIIVGGDGHLCSWSAP